MSHDHDQAKALRRLRLGATFSPLVQTSAIASHECAVFDHIKVAPPNAIFLTASEFNESKHPQKVNLGVGAYRDKNGKPFPLPSVLKAEEDLAKDMSRNKEYLGMEGHDGLLKVAQKLLFGENFAALKDGRIDSVQGISGTGALRLGTEFIAEHLPGRTVYLSKPTWENHATIVQSSKLQLKTYRYWDEANRNLHIDAMLADLSAAPQGSVVLLHACAHNPTGVDPTKDQWRQISDVCKQNKLFVFMDSAYQGFASGDPDRDAWAVRYFVEQGHEMLVAQSFAKNFGLYCERVGVLHVVAASKASAKASVSQLKLVIRHMYSNPPAHGARIVAHILNSPELTAQWRSELKQMSDRINSMRTALKAELLRLGTPGSWDHITTQIGMFTFTGLTVAQCKVLRSKHHCFLLDSGRISMAGLNEKNVAYFAKCVDDVVRNVA